jgi:amidohydrolase
MREAVVERIGSLKDRAVGRAAALAPTLCSLSDRIFHNPEIGFAERKASMWLTEFLQANGFQVERGLAGMETSFSGRVHGKSPGPVVALLAEYDALPEIGHGCGHNLIGVASCGAAAAVAGLMPELRGSLVVFGCPAEEGAVPGAGGKIALLRSGYFEGVDAAMMVHPASRYVVRSRSSARTALRIAFTGGDGQAACLLTFNAINSLRAHLGPSVKIHGIMSASVGAGEGRAVSGWVPAGEFEIRAYVRAPDSIRTAFCEERVKDCARGAAMAAGCDVEFSYTSPPYEELLTNGELASAFASNLEALGVSVEEHLDAGTGSTDMGNVSHATAALHAYIATCPRGIAGHTREFGRATLTQAAHEGMMVGVKALAMTVIDLLEDADLLRRVRTEFEKAART